jgi:glycosyltransferase involved in cell wall biosynthesis
MTKCHGKVCRQQQQEFNMKLSVQMVTFNHEAFIAKALDSVLMQRTNFEYEIVIGEDCSTDNTRNILLDYQKRYPHKFKLILNEKNMGMHKNGNQALEACEGEYVAILEGDDYWMSPDKLQKQVDFLDNNPECIICFHNAMMLYNDNSHESHAYCSPKQKEFSSIEDLLIMGNFMPSCSKMFRKKYIEIPDWIYSLKMGDWPIDILLARHGSIGYIDEIMGAYVIHHAGAWYAMRQDLEASSKANIEVYEKMYDVLPRKYRKLIRHILHKLCVDNAEKFESLGEIDKAGKYALKAFTDHCVMSKRMFKLLLKIKTPGTFNLLKSIKHVIS